LEGSVLATDGTRIHVDFEGKSSKFQAPSFRETSIIKLQYSGKRKVANPTRVKGRFMVRAPYLKG